ncbi:MAG: type II toxin-antitoxin system RelE/ParE family toxin [Gammaproteobacteria bacterium]|nr:type II toxin-antitoxin system RelE/ParE family toxin [Gammaproteobacteria bacterium]
MNPVRFEPQAVADADAAAAWYEAQRPGLGTEFLLEIDAAVERAADAPEAYNRQYRETRRVLLRRFPYSVYFLWEGGLVKVLAILHQHRDPSIWRSRLPSTGL